MSRSRDSLSSPKLVSSDVSNIALPVFGDPDGMFGLQEMEMGVSSFGVDHRDQEIKQLKGLFIMNLDLIQQQHDLLLANDRTIRTLQEENEMLKCRLERIERRMSLVQQKGTRQSVANFTTTEGIPDASESGRRREVKRRSTYESAPRLNPEIGIPASSINATIGDSEECSDLFEEKKFKSSQSNVGKASKRSQKTSKVESDKSRTVPDSVNLSLKEKIRALTDVAIKRKRNKRIRRNSEILMTDVLYYVQPIQAIESEDDLDDQSSSSELTIQVPSWRMKQIHTLYVMEGTENLDDHVFLKRHQKSESEEKRRKRWDFQRMRDMNLLRKQHQSLDDAPAYPLAAREENITFVPDPEKGLVKDIYIYHIHMRDMNLLRKQHQSLDDAPAYPLAAREENITFVPDPEKALYIEVGEKIPVMAFGLPLPYLQEKEFNLTWYDLGKDQLKQNKKGKPKKKS